MKKNILIVLLLCTNIAFSQTLMSGFDRFSSKKPAYITLNDGTKVVGEIDDLDRKKGNIEKITLQIGKKKQSFEPKDIKEMYLPPSGFDKFNKSIDAATSLTTKLDMNRVADGYAYFEYTEVNLKGKVMPLLMQLVNPGFHDKIRVYFDPYAMETVSVGFGPLKAGGIDKSYFIKVGNKPAEKFTKKEYDEQAPILFKDCPAALKQLKEDDEWNKFDRILFTHYNCK